MDIRYTVQRSVLVNALRLAAVVNQTDAERHRAGREEHIDKETSQRLLAYYEFHAKEANTIATQLANVDTIILVD